MKYRDKKNAGPVKPDAKYNRHKGYYNARAYRDAKNKGSK